MRGYVKRVYQKAEKLNKEQVLEVLVNVLEENDTLYSIFESISAGLLIVDNDFFLLQANSIVKSRLPFTQNVDEQKNSTIPIWDFLDDQDISSYLKNCYEKNITNSTEEFSIVTSGGSVRFITIVITPLILKNTLKGRIIVVRDITDTKNQEVRLHRMENMASLTNLAAGMAHEIKNPLGAIGIHIQLIQRALKKAREEKNILPDKKFLEDHIDIVNEEVEHLNKLIMDFLFAVRPIKSQLELKNPGALIKETISFVQPEFSEEKIKIDLQIKDKNQKLLIDEKLLRQMILNLAQNSLAAIKTKKEKDSSFEANITINCLLQDNKYLIIFSDNGCGMDEETLRKIFEPYYTTKANGTGLGMTMVFKIIKEFSGEILVDSEIGKGTSFKMTFPIPQKDKKLLTEEGGN